MSSTSESHGISLRIGIGYDVHPLVEGRTLFLGGIRIDHPRGLDGHSDADVLVHAVIDAVLGAAAMPDIGMLFPDRDPAYRDIRSIVLMEQVGRRITDEGITIVNIDAVVICQEPRIAPHVEAMRQAMATALGMNDSRRIGIRGKTTERLGFTGRGEGIAVHAVALVDRCR